VHQLLRAPVDAENEESEAASVLNDENMESKFQEESSRGASRHWQSKRLLPSRGHRHDCRDSETRDCAVVVTILMPAGALTPLTQSPLNSLNPLMRHLFSASLSTSPPEDSNPYSPVGIHPEPTSHCRTRQLGHRIHIPQRPLHEIPRREGRLEDRARGSLDQTLHLLSTILCRSD
jgi:hypothetical protein